MTPPWSHARQATNKKILDPVVVFLSKISGYDLVSLFTSLKCQALEFNRQSLGREETRALVQIMESHVENVVLGCLGGA